LQGGALRIFTSIAFGISVIHLYSCLNMLSWYLQYTDMMNQPEVVRMVDELDADNCDQPDWEGAEFIDDLPPEYANAVDDVCALWKAVHRGIFLYAHLNLPAPDCRVTPTGDVLAPAVAKITSC
jgi:hypothetical protein